MYDIHGSCDKVETLLVVKEVNGLGRCVDCSLAHWIV